ncbi:hypothetical protein EH165_00610 [Nakamurella antarctica]|uniref:Uncharacterized protein n=1 Tax=Nakamurella antarctica TaxID=1902245 RepID=A0A3G8ZI50_9ACTN|nr:hypothetical protein [Nakamurella antarctica]AZI56890.1 hypothetical protein EH165_00610 [Nakamurella antarctica]
MVIDRQRVPGALPVGKVWTRDEVSAQLAKAGLRRDYVVPVPVSFADLDPVAARGRQKQRRWIGVVMLVLACAALLVILRPGGAGWSALVAPLGFGAVCGSLSYYSQRERIASAVAQNSQAEGFVRALTNASTQLRGVRQRWLAFNDLGDAIVATQEERWGYQGAAPVLEVPWDSESGPIVSVMGKSGRFRSLVTLTFEDGSTVRLDLGRRNSTALTDSIGKPR